MSDGGLSAVTVTLADIARDVVAEQEPAQLPLLAAVTERWTNGAGRRPAGWTGGSVGIGVDPAILSELIYPVLTGAVAEVTGSTALSRWRRWRERRRSTPAPDTPITIAAGQIEQIRTDCVGRARALGLSAAKATVLADAVVGVLVRRLSEPAGGRD